jgi:hypothetical protein
VKRQKEEHQSESINIVARRTMSIFDGIKNIVAFQKDGIAVKT